MKNLSFNTYLSPFTWRYGSKEMRYIFSEEYKFKLWRKIWVALAQIQYQLGLLSKEEFKDLKKNKDNLNIEEILKIEKETKHDVVAAIKEFSQKAIIGGGKIHLGATSMDIVDNAEIIRIKKALQLISKRLKKILQLFAQKITSYSSFPCLGFTHLQSAQPTTVGYRLALYGQDFLIDYNLIQYFLFNWIKGKGFKGAVGTSAGYLQLLEKKKISWQKLEQKIMDELGIDSFSITSQVYPRKIDYWILSLLTSIAQSAAKFATDLRFLQSPVIGEWFEPFAKKQVGSSAMPFKKNPISCENICSLARYLFHLPSIALENAALCHLERTLDDSANKRIVIAESFLATDQILITVEKIISGLIINEKRINYNLSLYTPFATTETILMEAVKNGADRQKIHEVLRKISLSAWKQIQEGKPNPIIKLLFEDKRINKFLKKVKIKKLLNPKNYMGDAPQKAVDFAKKIEKL